MGGDLFWSQVREVLDEIGFADDSSNNDGSNNTRLYVAITGRGIYLL